MKKLLLFSSFLIPVISQAQLIVEDNFDSYTAGTGVAAQSTNWDTWTGATNIDALVSTEQAFSTPNSMKVNQTGNDMVLPLGPYTTGAYEATWKMYIPNGEGGYFNALHTWAANSTTYEWAVDVFFSASGAIATVAGSVEEASPVNYTSDTWFDVKLYVNLTADVGKVFINGTEIRSFQWSLNNANGLAGTNRLVAINFYGTEGPNGANTGGIYYVDDVAVNQVSDVLATEEKADLVLTPSFYPNPVSSELTLETPPSFNGGTVSIFDLTGKVVYTHAIATEDQIQRINVSDLSQGIYMIQWKKANMVKTMRMIKK